MQPYIFPYIGYFQLIKAVDKFIFYDDVNYIKGGWINRNNILINKNKSLFTIPLDKASPFITINETNINLKIFREWRLKFLKTMEQSYKKAPYYSQTYSIIVKILNQDVEKISQLAINSIVEISNFLNIKTEFELSSESYPLTNKIDRVERLLDICKKNNALDYINPIGGIELYTKEDFIKADIRLHFIKSMPIKYLQFGNEFIEWLSIIDVLMFNSPEKINIMLDDYFLL